MRNTSDATGYAVHVAAIHADNAFSGMIEGNPYLSRKWRVLTGKKWMEQPGRLVHGLDEIERELASMDMRHTVWPPCERWEARVVDQADFSAWTQRSLQVLWYQEGGDPMARLQEIVSALDFRALAAVVSVDRPD